MSPPAPAPPPLGIQVYDHGDRVDCVMEGSPTSAIARVGFLVLAMGLIVVGWVHVKVLAVLVIMALVVYARWKGLGGLGPLGREATAVTSVPSLVLTLTDQRLGVRERGGAQRELPLARLRTCQVQRRWGRYELVLVTPDAQLTVGRGQDPSALYWLERQVLRRAVLHLPEGLLEDKPTWIPVPPIQQVGITTDLDGVRLAMAAGFGRTLHLDLGPRALVLREKLGPLTLRTLRTPLDGIRAVVSRERWLDLDTGQGVVRVGRGLTYEALGWLKSVLDRARERRHIALAAEAPTEAEARPPEALLGLKRRAGAHRRDSRGREW